MTNGLNTRLQTILGAISGRFIDRNEVVRGIMLGLISRQHVLMVGPPGTGKSALATAATGAITDARCFSKLLSRTTTPEEIWGPLDLLAFDQGRLERRSGNFLPGAHVAFLDEVWRGSSAILNGLLMAVNERQWEQDGRLLALPLRMVIAASNSLPEPGDLDALHDRFALRYFVGRLSRKRDRRALLKLGRSQAPSVQVTLAELDTAHDEAMGTPLTEAAMDGLLQVWDALDVAGYDVSERRWRQVADLMRASAWLDGRGEAGLEDVEVVADSAWLKPESRSAVLQVVLAHSMPNVARAAEIADAAHAAVKRVPKFDGTNDVQVATAAAEAKRAINALMTDLVCVRSHAAPHEAQRLSDYVARIDKVRDNLTRRMSDAIHGV